MFHRVLAWLLVIGISTVAVGSTASAQGQIEPFDSNGGYDHLSDPPPGSASSADWCFSFDDFFMVDQTIEVTAGSGSGTLTGQGVVGSDGTVRVRVGIDQGGTYDVMSIVALESGQSISTSSVDPVDVVFDPEFVDCFDGLTTAPPAVVSTSSTTEVTTSTTEATTTSSETSASAPPTSEPATVAPPLDESSGSSNLLIYVGVAMLFVAAFIAFFPGITIGTSERCKREREEVARWIAELEKAEKAEKANRAEEKRLKKEAEAIRFKRTSNQQQREMDERKLVGEHRDAMEATGQASAYVKTVTETLAKAVRALEACEKRPESGGLPGGSAPPPEEAKEKQPDCCPKGNWVGFNVFTGGIIVGGVESGYITLFCVDDPERWAIVKYTGTRLGLAAGGEVGAGVFLLFGAGIHPANLPKAVAGVLKGGDFDFSVGLSWSKLAKGFVKTGGNWGKLKKLKESVEAAKAGSKALDTARKTGTISDASKIAMENAQVFKELVREGGSDMFSELAAKGGLSGVQAGGSGVQIPFGKGLQVGIWWLFEPKVELYDLSGCKNCDPSYGSSK